jgi:hypothetical protein
LAVDERKDDLPNQLWQADVIHWQPADHTDIEILDIIDDHSWVAMPDTGCVMPSLPQEELPRDPGILKALGHNRIDVAGWLHPCAGIHAVVEATGTMRGNDPVSLI